VGWTVGKAPKVDVDKKYIPRFARYATTYTKLSVIGLSEYKCALLLDADTLVVGSLDDFLGCDVFDKPAYRVAGTLDYYHGKWYHFNTGSLLWRTSVGEMGRIFNLTRDESFMRRFESDQIFLNTAYPDRTDVTKNLKILEGDLGQENWGQVVPLPWIFNAQTHVEVQLPEYWNKNLHDVKIIHFTEKKGWQCPERHGSAPPLEEMPEKCDKTIPICFCREGYRWWDSLDEAEQIIKAKSLRPLN